MVKFQLDWWPESTKWPYQMLIGGRYTVDTVHKEVTGDLMDAGKPTGLRVRLIAGGPAIGGVPTPVALSVNSDVLLGQSSTFADVVTGYAGSGPSRTVAVMAPLAHSPVGFMFDPAAHPEFHSLVDIGQSDTPVLSYPGPVTDYLTNSGILRPSQVDRSYDGSPTRLANDHQVVVGGYATHEPYTYAHLTTTTPIKVEFHYLAESGFDDYADAIVVRADNVTAYGPCLRRLVPIMQRAEAAYLSTPDPTLQLISTLAHAYKAYPYSLEEGRYGVSVLRREGLTSNDGGRLGGISTERVRKILGIMRPILAGQHASVPADLNAEDLFTTQFLSPITLP